MGDSLQPSRRTAVRAGAWVVPVVTVAAVAPALAASGTQPWESSRWDMQVNALWTGARISISFQLDSGQTKVPADSTIRVWVDDVELTVAHWHSAAWVTIGSDDSADPWIFSQVTITVEIVTPTGAVHTLVSPLVFAVGTPDLP